MTYIKVDSINGLPSYVKDVVRGNRSSGYYLPDNIFYRRLLESIDTTTVEKKTYPVIDPTLIECQQIALNRMFEQNRLLINLSPGLGKSYVTSSFLRNSENSNVIIVAPKALHYVWEQHLHDYTNINYVVRPKEHLKHRITITNIQQIPKLNLVDKPDIVIVDESIVIKNRKSKNYKNIKDKFGNVKQLYLLSGSPYSKSISDLWAQLNLLDPKTFTSFWDFAKIFCRIVIDRYGWKIKENRDDIEPILKYVLDPWMVSAHIDDNVELPEQKKFILNIPPSRLQLQIEKEFKKNFKYGEIVINGPLSLLTRLKQLSLSLSLLGIDKKSEKEEALKDMLEVVEYPCIIASTSNVFLSQQHKLYDSSTIFNADNQDGYKSFVSGEKDLLFLQMQSGKFGHSFTIAKTLIICDYTFNSDDLYQLLARVKRFTTKHVVTVYHLHSLPIDKIMYELAEERNLSVETVLRKMEEN